MKLLLLASFTLMFSILYTFEKFILFFSILIVYCICKQTYKLTQEMPDPPLKEGCL